MRDTPAMPDNAPSPSLADRSEAVPDRPTTLQLLVDRHGLEPARTVLIDDTIANVRAAASLGFRAIQFTGAADLRRDLNAMGLLDASPDLSDST